MIVISYCRWANSLNRVSLNMRSILRTALLPMHEFYACPVQVLLALSPDTGTFDAGTLHLTCPRDKPTVQSDWVHVKPEAVTTWGPGVIRAASLCPSIFSTCTTRVSSIGCSPKRNEA